MKTVKYPDLWKSIVAAELARNLTDNCHADFFAARDAYERMAAERDRVA